LATGVASLSDMQPGHGGMLTRFADDMRSALGRVRSRLRSGAVEAVEAQRVAGGMSAALARTVRVAMLLVLSISIASADAARPYTLADLEALVKKRAWVELVDHLDDVAPTSRDARWESVARDGALGVLAMAGATGPADGLAAADELLARYPTLKDSKDFMAKRARAGVAAFEQCFRKQRWFASCAKRVRAFVVADPRDTELAFRVGKLVPNGERARAVPAFAIAIHKRDDERCKDADVRSAVLAGLAIAESSDPELVADAVQLASATCWNALHAAVRDAMGGGSADYLANTCPFVKARQSLPSLLTKQCEKATKTN
jgi:hypothetical protein